MGFSFSLLGRAPGVGHGGTGGCGGGQKLFFLKFNQIWFVSYSHEWHSKCHNVFVPAPWGLGEGPNG